MVDTCQTAELESCYNIIIDRYFNVAISLNSGDANSWIIRNLFFNTASVQPVCPELVLMTHVSSLVRTVMLRSSSLQLMVVLMLWWTVVRMGNM